MKEEDSDFPFDESQLVDAFAVAVDIIAAFPFDESQPALAEIALQLGIDPAELRKWAQEQAPKSRAR